MEDKVCEEEEKEDDNMYSTYDNETLCFKPIRPTSSLVSFHEGRCIYAKTMNECRPCAT